MGMEVSSPGVSPMGLEAGTVPHTYEVYGIPVSACAVVYEGTFRYQLAKLSMNLIFFYLLVPQYLWNLLV